MKKPSWYRILEAARRIPPKGEINYKTLASEAKLPTDFASAWLGKLAKWGYLRRAGRSALGGRALAFVLTEYGHTVQAPKTRHYEGE